MNAVDTPEVPVTALFKLPDGYAPGDTVLTQVNDCTLVVGMVSARDPGPETVPGSGAPQYADWASTGAPVQRGLVLPILVLARLLDFNGTPPVSAPGLCSPLGHEWKPQNDRFAPLSQLITDTRMSAKYDFANELGMVTRIRSGDMLGLKATGLNPGHQNLYQTYAWRSLPQAWIEMAQAVALVRYVVEWRTSKGHFQENMVGNTELLKVFGMHRDIRKWNPFLEALQQHLTAGLSVK
jgi:hypothetical protein